MTLFEYIQENKSKDNPTFAEAVDLWGEYKLIQADKRLAEAQKAVAEAAEKQAGKMEGSDLPF